MEKVNIMVLKFVHRGTKNQVLLVKDNSYINIKFLYILEL